MALIDEVKGEIMQRHEKAVEQRIGPKEQNAQEAPAEKPRRRRRKNIENMTKEEVEEYKRKMMEQEEARYLGSHKKARGRLRKQNPEQAQKSDSVLVAPKVQKEPKARQSRTPRMLQPLEPLYILKVPGLPKGDAIVICLTHGVE